MSEKSPLLKLPAEIQHRVSSFLSLPDPVSFDQECENFVETLPLLSLNSHRSLEMKSLLDELTPNDVPFGRGGVLNGLRRRNVFYQRLLHDHWEVYVDLKRTTQKIEYIKNHIMVPIYQSGGRFLQLVKAKRGKSNVAVTWEAVSQEEMIVTKIGQALRDKRKAAAKRCYPAKSTPDHATLGTKTQVDGGSETRPGGSPGSPDEMETRSPGSPDEQAETGSSGGPDEVKTRSSGSPDKKQNDISDSSDAQQALILKAQNIESMIAMAEARNSELLLSVERLEALTRENEDAHYLMLARDFQLRELQKENARLLAENHALISRKDMESTT